MRYDKVIIGAGLYGLYAALFCAKRGEKVIVLEYDEQPFMRATYINQARVHMGYHYPRSYSTAKKSANYFKRFHTDYGFCVNSEFQKIYATSKKFSWTNACQFIRFCKDTGIPCEEVSPEKFFNKDMCDGAFLTKEYTYDAFILRDFFLDELSRYRNVTILTNTKILYIYKDNKEFAIQLENNLLHTSFVLNATYASMNQILGMLQFDPFKIKYELCEIILCKVNSKLQNYGITVMDGPFFSIMPFGKTGYHSLTSVTFTPHKTSFDVMPTFECQSRSHGYCSVKQLGNCSLCPARPATAYDYMSKLAEKYLNHTYRFEYYKSLFSMKPILKASEIDDSRPTVIKIFSETPKFVSVLSGKINTVYDLDEVLI